MVMFQNGTISLADDTMHYIRFGTGARVLVMLPGLGDGLTTVKGTALPMAVMYRAFSKLLHVQPPQQPASRLLR